MRYLAAVCFLGVLASGSLSSCAYYNGMYNANKYSNDAQRSERAGRPAEARERWQLAAIHAESVVARHPRSRWADDARLVQGRALVHLESWTAAVVALREAAQRTTDDEQRLEALWLLGEANIALRRFAEAEAALDTAVTSTNAVRRAQALLARGRLRLLRRDASGADADFTASSAPVAPLWAARAALVQGDALRAAGALGGAIDRPKLAASEDQWLGLLDSLAAAGAPVEAAELTERLVANRRVGTGMRARLLLSDGARRVQRGDRIAAAARYRAAAALAPDSAEARVAELRLALLGLDETGDGALDSTIRVAEAVTRQGGSAAREAGPIVRLLAKARSLARDTAPGGDARWLARAELLRDSLGLPRYAAATLGGMAERFPASPFAPKALIAALDDHPRADSLAAVLHSRYGESPYVAAWQGRDTPRYAALEDSLRGMLAEAAQRPAAGPDEGEGDEPLRRRLPGARPAPVQPRPQPPQARPAQTPRPTTPQPQPRNPQP